MSKGNITNQGNIGSENIGSYGTSGLTDAGPTFVTGTSFAQLQVPPSPPPRSLELLREQLNEALNRACDARLRARSIADDVLGAIPETSGSGVDKSSDGRVDKLLAIVRELNGMLSLLSAEIDRLCCL